MDLRRNVDMSFICNIHIDCLQTCEKIIFCRRGPLLSKKLSFIEVMLQSTLTISLFHQILIPKDHKIADPYQIR